jgi:protein-S-isoprenylcysteine O-methyltransferase Ste14
MPFPTLLAMNPWWAKGAVLLATVVLIAIRAPHGQRSRSVPVERSHKGRLEVALLTLAWVGFLLPLLWVATPLFARADFPLHPAPYAAGLVSLTFGLWLFHRSHADLGRHWSITLELREQHALVTGGVYRRIRHPMYSALFLYCIGQALVLPNWVAGPSYLVSFLLLFALRLGPEERMLRGQFGDEYAEYAARTKRLVPGVW